MAAVKGSGERRRVFTAECKLEAVRRMEERRAGGNLSRTGRELGVRPDQLRTWTRQHEQRAGATRATTLPLAALHRALRLRRPPPGLSHHTERGSQYACQEYRAVLAAHGVRQSLSRRGDRWDTAVSESVFAPLEHELRADAAVHRRREAHAAVAEFIATGYNGERRHSTLGYVSPVQYEQPLRQQAARAA